MKKIKEQVERDKTLFQLRTEGNISKKKYRQLLLENELLNEKLAVLAHLNQTPQFLKILPTQNGSEATAVIVASDWHIEERVRRGDVSGLNEFNLTIAEERVNRFWYNSVRLIKMFQKEKTIKHIVLAFLGD